LVWPVVLFVASMGRIDAGLLGQVNPPNSEWSTYGGRRQDRR
jgi:hypothetical protein